MKIRISTAILTEKLYRVQGIASAKSTSPILNHVLFEARDNEIKIAATDNDISIEETFLSEVEIPGAIALPSKNFFEIIKALPPGEMTLKLLENNRVEIKAGKSQFKLVGLSKEEFPTLPLAENSQKHSLLARDLVGMIDKTIYCTSNDEARFNLGGIFWHATRDTLGESLIRFVATDGHRLAICEKKMALQEGFFETSAIVSKRTMSEIRRIASTFPLDDDDFRIEYSFSQNHAYFRIGSVQMSARLIEGDFPDYKQVLPKNHDKVLRASKQELVEALKRVILLSPDKSYSVKFKIVPGSLTIESQNPALGEALQEIDINYEGPDISIGFNAHYLIEALQMVSEGGVRMELFDHISPNVIRPLENSDYLAVVMPMRI